MKLAKRTENLTESVTLKLNAQASQMVEEGKKVFNLTAGQLPFRPPIEFTSIISREVEFLKSFQYSPVPGFKELRDKVLTQFEETRKVSFSSVDVEASVVIGNGGKHVLANLFSCLIDPGDEVILFSPYWISYPEMIKLNEGVYHIVDSSVFNAFVPCLDKLKETLNNNTKMIVLNSPNNPTGIHYPENWMRDFAKLLKDFPEVIIISDEIYFSLSYFDPTPTYFYQFDQDLLSRTFIVDGISKSLACTGLRIGWAIGPKEVINAVSRYQGQTSSGANSLVQRGLEKFDFALQESFLEPVKLHLRENTRVLQEKFRSAKLNSAWYQSLSAFYYLIDFSKSPIFDRYTRKEVLEGDYAVQICADLLETRGVALVPGSDFGAPNTARLSLVSPRATFEEAIDQLVSFMLGD